MKHISRYILTLALLIMAVGGAWAQSSLKVVEFEVPANWEGDNSNVTAADLPGFKAVTLAEAQAWTGAPAGSMALFVYAFDGDNICFVPFFFGTDGNEDKHTYTKDGIFNEKSNNVKFYYPAEITEWDLKPDETGKKWTLAEMPASDVELQVEYFAESNLFLSKEALADKASIAVTAGDQGVQFGEDGKSANPVAEGTAMTVKYNGTKKILGMKVEKKVTPPEVGQIIGSDGKNYDANATLPTGVTAVAMIAYVGSETGVEGYTHGLALALTDKASTMNWTNATGASGAAAHTPAAPTPMTSSWMLPSKDQWTKMINAAGSYTALRNGFSGITGASNLQSVSYWSSTGFTSSDAWGYSFGNGGWLPLDKGRAYQVRACLAF